MYAVGLNTHGQLGLGHREDVVHATPISCLRGSPIVQIACGAHHSLIISKSGSVNIDQILILTSVFIQSFLKDGVRLWTKCVRMN